MLDHPLIRFVIYHTISGNLLYVAVAVLAAVTAWRVAGGLGGWVRYVDRAVNVVGVVAGVGVLFAAASWTLAWAAAVVALGMTAILARRYRRIAAGTASVAIVLLGVAGGQAWQYERGSRPTLAATGDPQQANGAEVRPLAVFGDSLSADHLHHTWPEQLAERLDTRLINHAQPGAKLANRLSALDRGPVESALVIVLLGGNDILAPSPTPLGQFTAELDDLLTRLDAANNTIVMIELPSPPNLPQYGWAQRRLAERHNVHLVPRRMLAKLFFGDPANTSDGIHLTQQGHDHLATWMHTWLHDDR